MQYYTRAFVNIAMCVMFIFCLAHLGDRYYTFIKSVIIILRYYSIYTY